MLRPDLPPSFFELTRFGGIDAYSKLARSILGFHPTRNLLIGKQAYDSEEMFERGIEIRWSV